jgi:hypothetical protein
MVRDEVFGSLRKDSYPSDDQEAAERVSDAMNMPDGKAAVIAAVDGNPTDEQAVAKIGATSKASFEGLVRCLFKDVDQFRRALSEYGWNLERPKAICKNGFAQTYRAVAVGPNGSEYLFILNDIANRGCEVVNCCLSVVGDNVDGEDLEAYRAVAGSAGK